MKYFDKRGKAMVKEFVKSMRRRGHSRGFVMAMIDEVEAELCPLMIEPNETPVNNNEAAKLPGL